MPEQPKKQYSVTDEELAKIREFKKRVGSSASPLVGDEWLVISEFGYYYGWAGIEAVLNNQITAEVMGALLQGARKVWSGKVVDHSLASFYASAAAQSKKPKQVLEKGLKGYMDGAKPDGKL